MTSAKQQPITPIIIIGAGRSGTKFLRDCLRASAGVSAVPYDVGYIWRLGNNQSQHDELDPAACDESYARQIRKLIMRMAEPKISSDTRFLIEKSVTNTLNVALVAKVFPEAKLIHLLRDGRAVAESASRMWTEPPGGGYLLKKLRYFPWRSYRHAIWYVSNILKGKFSGGRGQLVWGPRYKGMDSDARDLPLMTVCARQWRKCVTAARAGLAALPSDRVLEIRYEDLVSGPETMSAICDFIGLSDGEDVARHLAENLRPGEIDKWKSRLSADDLALVMNEAGDVLSDVGYE